MISMDRETLMMISTVVCVGAIIFLFKEMNKAKTDVENLKNFSSHLVQKLSATENQRINIKTENQTEKTEEISEEKTEE